MAHDMAKAEYTYYSCDFETTVYEDQDITEVWAAAIVEFYTEDVHIYHSLPDMLEYCYSLKKNCILYFHNLKFDGAFWLDYLLRVKKLKQAYYRDIENDTYKWKRTTKMENNSFKYSISDKGRWYTIIIKHNNKIIEIRDSLKLIPFSVKEIGDAFKTKHRKLEMEYEGFRYPGCVITDTEKQYISNDVLVVKEALEFMFRDGHNKLTIGSCCLDEMKKIIGEKEFKALMPNVFESPFVNRRKDVRQFDSLGDYILKSYHGAWCYVVEGKEQRILNNGITLDINSLYPYVMHSDSGNVYPIGYGKYWNGNFIPSEAYQENRFYYIRVKTRFYLKPGKLPFIQIKGNMLYKGTECLKSSDIYNSETGKYSPYYTDCNGALCDTRVEMNLACVDYDLIREHYYLVDFEIIDGVIFGATKGIFDEYIDKYKQIKINSKGAIRTQAKLFSNNAYGKLASNTCSSFKIAYIKEDGSTGFETIEEYDKEPGYIPAGAAITAYARAYTIRIAQMNYHGTARGFAYADTDSLHCDISWDEIVGVKLHPTEYGAFKMETRWDYGFFTRQKTYIEHVIEKDQEPCTPYYNITCAGMPDNVKRLFVLTLKPKEEWTKDDIAWLSKQKDDEILYTSKTHKITDFKRGLKVPGKLIPKRIKGGVVLKSIDYEMH